MDRRRDEEWLTHPAEDLARRLDTHLAGTPTTEGILHVLAEWLDDVENTHTVICRNPGKGEPDWYPRPPSVSWIRRELHRMASLRTLLPNRGKSPE